MENNAVIKGVACYHPKNKVNNQFFINYFKEKGENIEGLLETTGRKNRYISDDSRENTVTMCYEAASRVLEQVHVKANQLGMIIFSSGTPEYMLPPNSVKLHAMLGAASKCAVYDLNANCAGMTVALDMASRCLRNNKNIKYALIAGSDQLNRYSRYNEPLAYTNFGDSACALVLENMFDTERGFIDSDYYTNSSNHDKMVFPAKGLSNVVSNKELPTKDKLVQWVPFDYSGAFHSAKVSIEDILFRNGRKSAISKNILFRSLPGKALRAYARTWTRIFPSLILSETSTVIPIRPARC